MGLQELEPERFHFVWFAVSRLCVWPTRLPLDSLVFRGGLTLFGMLGSPHELFLKYRQLSEQECMSIHLSILLFHDAVLFQYNLFDAQG